MNERPIDDDSDEDSDEDDDDGGDGGVEDDDDSGEDSSEYYSDVRCSNSDNAVHSLIEHPRLKLRLTKTLSTSSMESASLKIRLPKANVIAAARNSNKSTNSSGKRLIIELSSEDDTNSSNKSVKNHVIQSSESDEDDDNDDDDDLVSISGRKRAASKTILSSTSPSPNAVRIAHPTESTEEEAKKELIYNLALKERKQLLKEIDDLNLPGNPLDMLIDEFGGYKKVAEMTGRRGRFIRNDNGELRYVKRSENGVALPQQNIYERELFMSDKKQIAIISEAASSGISLHADRRCKNQRKRVHITLELPWSADKAIQQLGRTHRSNQASSPDYYLLISPQGVYTSI
jgi:hypothetical protein